MRAQNPSTSYLLSRLVIATLFMPAGVYDKALQQQFFDPNVRYFSILHASSAPVRYRYLFDPLAVIARSPPTPSP